LNTKRTEEIDDELASPSYQLRIKLIGNQLGKRRFFFAKGRMRDLAMLEIKETKSTNIIWTDIVFLQLALVYTRHAFIWNIIITLIS